MIYPFEGGVSPECVWELDILSYRVHTSSISISAYLGLSARTLTTSIVFGMKN